MGESVNRSKNMTIKYLNFYLCQESSASVRQYPCGITGASTPVRTSGTSLLIFIFAVWDRIGRVSQKSIMLISSYVSKSMIFVLNMCSKISKWLCQKIKNAPKSMSESFSLYNVVWYTPFFRNTQMKRHIPDTIKILKSFL